MLEGLLVDLVPFGERYLAQEHRWHNGPATFFWAVGGRWIMSQAQVREWQNERSEEREHGDPRRLFGIQTKDGRPIGLIGVRDLEPANRLASLSANIGEPDYWGGGYGTDALLLLIDYLFGWWDCRKIWLSTMSLNARVMRQMEKVGFRLEARHREATWADRTRADILTYGLLCDEWPGRAAMIERLGLKVRSAMVEGMENHA